MIQPVFLVVPAACLLTRRRVVRQQDYRQMLLGPMALVTAPNAGRRVIVDIIR